MPGQNWGTTQGMYFEKMIGSSSTNFADMVTIGERVENGLRLGKIIDTAAPQTSKKRPHGGFAKKKEGEENTVTASARPQYQFLMAPMSYYPYPYVTLAQYQQSSFQYQPHKCNQQSMPAQRNPNQQYKCDDKGKNRGQNNRNNFGNRPQFDKIRVPYVELVSYLIHVGAIVPKELLATSPPFNRSHNPNATCAFHAGYIGHSTEDCWALKKRIQELIVQDILYFSEEKPNVKTNPLPNHAGVAVNVVIEEENVESILRAEEVKTPIKKKVEAPPKRTQPIHFRVPTLFPYQDTKAVPWNYETTMYLGGKEICIPDTEIVNIAGTGGMTRSGHAGVIVPAAPSVTTASVLTKVIDDKAAESETSKGKGPMVEKEQVEDHKKSITFEESQEFLKLIKKSDFKIVDQLNQTPSKILMLSLLMSSEAHRKALLKVLNFAHVMQDITVDQFDDVVANITANRHLGFNEAELPLEGNAHNKALHI
ncbi:uncharacterized protein LOC127078828 [Lathyrus oleraceus]|uniref:uncharacterized protein LOC127078828 n=1 Tax=Pisum sativum TaxID=3888 RepID=UPI0021CF793E|nr:uncharacterized protein LOC127078828 [Pisum sativum]